MRRNNIRRCRSNPCHTPRPGTPRRLGAPHLQPQHPTRHWRTRRAGRCHWPWTTRTPRLKTPRLKNWHCWLRRCWTPPGWMRPLPCWKSPPARCWENQMTTTKNWLARWTKHRSFQPGCWTLRGLNFPPHCFPQCCCFRVRCCWTGPRRWTHFPAGSVHPHTPRRSRNLRRWCSCCPPATCCTRWSPPTPQAPAPPHASWPCSRLASVKRTLQGPHSRQQRHHALGAMGAALSRP